jgi:hypothetical protein
MASAARDMRAVLFWFITQRIVVIPYRRFGTTYRSLESPENVSDRLFRKRRQGITTTRSVITHKSAVLKGLLSETL